MLVNSMYNTNILYRNYFFLNPLEEIKNLLGNNKNLMHFKQITLNPIVNIDNIVTTTLRNV